MNTKALAHSIQLGIRNATGLQVKRSQVHELMAAALGHGSQAAMLAQGVACPMPPALAKHQDLDRPCIARRVQTLGLLDNSAGKIEHVVLGAMESAAIRMLPLDLAVSILLEGRYELYADDLQSHVGKSNELTERAEDDDLSYLDDEQWHARQQEELDAVIDLSSEQVLASLNAAIDRCDARAHLCMALLLAGDPEALAHVGDSGGGKYWFDQEQKGKELVGVEKEWAEGYKQQVALRGEMHGHLVKAADLGHPDALLLMAQHHGDPRFFSLTCPRINGDPMFVASLADQLGYPAAAQIWLERAAYEGDMMAMRALIRDHHKNNPLKCWTWFNLAQLHGTDLTADDYRAVHDDGSIYDDDVGGPLHVVGEPGIELPEADDATRRDAKMQAQVIFSR